MPGGGGYIRQRYLTRTSNDAREGDGGIFTVCTYSRATAPARLLVAGTGRYSLIHGCQFHQRPKAACSTQTSQGRFSPTLWHFRTDKYLPRTVLKSTAAAPAQGQGNFKVHETSTYIHTTMRGPDSACFFLFQPQLFVCPPHRCMYMLYILPATGNYLGMVSSDSQEDAAKRGGRICLSLSLSKCNT